MCGVKNNIDPKDLAETFFNASPEEWQTFFLTLYKLFELSGNKPMESKANIKFKKVAEKLSHTHGADSKYFIKRLHNMIVHYELIE